MIQSIQLCLKHKRRIDFKKKMIFSPGFNTVIGPNGSGKSSLLRAIDACRACRRQEETKTRYHYFNSETMNPHRDARFFKGIEGSMVKVRAMFSSHGETMRDVLRCIKVEPGDCFLCDEPEAGHDLNWIIRIRKGLDQLVKRKCQIIAASHHPVFWNKANVIELQHNYSKNTREKIRKWIR